MKSVLFLLYLTTVSYGFENVDRHDQFNTYMKTYNKSYSTNEYEYRFNVFCKNMEYVDKHNSQSNRTYDMGMNPFTDMTHSEFSSKWLMKPIDGTQHNQGKHTHRYNMRELSNIPTSMDWRSMGYVTDIKDQGHCGSCWAFSAVGVIEGQHAKVNQTLVSLSEENIVDCSSSFGNYGCEGGWPEAGMRYVINNTGIDTEESYPYTAGTSGFGGNCSYNNNSVGATLSKTVNITSGSMADLYHAMATIGPISVALDAEYDFQMYSSGIFKSTACSNTSLDHALVAVGYGVSKDGQKYIIIKNSWNTNWGMDGYIYFSADIDNMCGVATTASYGLV